MAKKGPDKEAIHSQPVEDVAMDTVGAKRSTCTRKASAGERAERKKGGRGRRRRRGRRRSRGAELSARPTLFPFVCVYVALPGSVRVEGVLLPLLAAEWVEALGITMSKEASGGCCVGSRHGPGQKWLFELLSDHTAGLHDIS